MTKEKVNALGNMLDELHDRVLENVKEEFGLPRMNDRGGKLD